MKRCFFILMMTIFVFTAQNVFSISTNPVIKTHKVGVLKLPHSATLDHISIALWQSVAKKINFKYVLVPYKSESSAYNALENHKIDLFIGPVKLRPYSKKFSFLNSYINDDVGVAMGPNSVASIWPYIRVLLGYGVGTIILILFIFGTIIWLLERNKNSDEFPKSAREGIIEGMWFALVTMTTVGYGRTVPITKLGRFATFIFMLVVLFTLSTFMVYITASLSSDKINEIHLKSLTSLAGKRIAYVSGNKDAKELIEAYNSRPIKTYSIKQAVNYLEADKVDALFANSIRLRAFLHKQPMRKVYLTSYAISNGSYAFAIRKNYAMAELINEALFTIHETGGIDKIKQAWIGYQPHRGSVSKFCIH